MLRWDFIQRIVLKLTFFIQCDVFHVDRMCTHAHILDTLASDHTGVGTKDIGKVAMCNLFLCSVIGSNSSIQMIGKKPL